MRRLVVVIALACGVAHADDKPWAANVSADNQRDALALYQKGNAFFELAQYKEAFGEYERALALWDHPGIRYNAAVCLINLDRPVEAYENVLAALRFGDAPLGAELYKQGLNYKKLLSNQVAELEIQSSDTGAAISLDGKPWFEAPGSATRHVSTKDPHQILATKPGYQPETRVIQLRPGPKITLVIKLKPLATRKLVRRWEWWKPWAVVVGGAVIGAAGLPFWFDARAKFSRYDDAVDQLCRPNGCSTQMDLELRAEGVGLSDEVQFKGPARVNERISQSAFVVGGVAVATGMALVLLNQRRLGAPAVTPTVGSDRVGVTISAYW